MSLCLNARQNRRRVPSCLDPSSELDLMATHQSEREEFSLGLRGGTLYWYPSGSATEPGKGHLGNLGQLWIASVRRGHRPTNMSIRVMLLS